MVSLARRCGMASLMVRTGIVMMALLGPVTSASGFGFDTVINKAKRTAEQTYQAPETVPPFLQDLSYQQYREIRFKRGQSLWRGAGSRFQAMMMMPGTYYRHAVTLHQVTADGVQPVPFNRNHFNYPNQALAKRIPADLGYTGFKLTYPLDDADSRNEFLVFAGASYFRGVGAGQHFGLSARGIAIDTGLPSGEEVPVFTEYWLERPAADADSMRVYALLNGPSVTGAYRFQIRPGDTTSIEVTARLFFRDDVELPGFAPLTSMFYYGENTMRPRGEWRPQVHDSDGLLIHDGKTGEWLWRPLLNPRSLRMSYLQTHNVRGFGLMQRDTDFSRFEDPEARYDKRPSAWVETQGDWGKGDVVLVEIPTESETNDNIVAFWKPDTGVRTDSAMTLEYTLHFGDAMVPDQPSGRAVQSFFGDGNRTGGGDAEGAYRVIVDFADGPLESLGPDASVVSKVSGGDHVDILEQYVEYVAADEEWRLSMLVRPEAEEALSLRAFLSLNGDPLTETWTYELPPGADLRSGEEN